MAMTLILSEAGQPAEPGARVRSVWFKDQEGNTVLEVKSDGVVEVLDQDGNVFSIDADGNVEG